MRAAIYARYSTDMQSAASIEDQIRVCRERIERERWTYYASYSDRAVSGASRLRRNYQALLEDARRGAFDIVVAEALDRLSRDRKTWHSFQTLVVRWHQAFHAQRRRDFRDPYRPIGHHGCALRQAAGRKDAARFARSGGAGSLGRRAEFRL